MTLIAHEQIIFCTQLFAGYMVGPGADEKDK